MNGFSTRSRNCKETALTEQSRYGDLNNWRCAWNQIDGRNSESGRRIEENLGRSSRNTSGSLGQPNVIKLLFHRGALIHASDPEIFSSGLFALYFKNLVVRVRGEYGTSFHNNL
ncbi:hypothetical protein Tco_0556554 [Tanacetum coccineum]